MFTVMDSDLEDGTSCFFTPLLRDSWDLLQVFYVPQPDGPVLQRPGVNISFERVNTRGADPVQLTKSN